MAGIIKLILKKKFGSVLYVIVWLRIRFIGGLLLTV